MTHMFGAGVQGMPVHVYVGQGYAHILSSGQGSGTEAREVSSRSTGTQRHNETITRETKVVERRRSRDQRFASNFCI